MTAHGDTGFTLIAAHADAGTLADGLCSFLFNVADLRAPAAASAGYEDFAHPSGYGPNDG